MLSLWPVKQVFNCVSWRASVVPGPFWGQMTNTFVDSRAMFWPLCLCLLIDVEQKTGALHL